MNPNHSEMLTQHAMLVVWGQFAQAIGLIEKLQSVGLHQKTVVHSPQRKVLEFLVALLAGLEHLQDLSRAAHPIDQDQAVARAWGQTAWADYSGVSRTLAELTQAEAEQIAAVLAQISAPIQAEEVMRALQRTGRLTYDADLTGRPVSNTSTTYPGAAYGYMGDGVHLGYQAAMLSCHSPTYGRLWLSVTSHPGDTVSGTQTEALLQAAEAKTGVRPLRRTALLQERIRHLELAGQEDEAKAQEAAATLTQARTRLTETRQQAPEQQATLRRLEAEYQAHQRPERPHSKLAQARQRLNLLERRQQQLEKRIPALERQVLARQQQGGFYQAQIRLLQQRLKQFERDNHTNPDPILADFRLDAGFGNRENVALGIEMGYELYTKPYSDWLPPRLKRRVGALTQWTQVGANAEMVVWKAERFHDFPYPLDVALERFYTGKTLRYSPLIHFGATPVTAQPAGWFQRYNARQLIEAGIKEGKNIFTMHYLKVRAAPALFLQEQLAILPPISCAGRRAGSTSRVSASLTKGTPRPNSR